jgi:signal transduction histidine kinase
MLAAYLRHHRPKDLVFTILLSVCLTRMLLQKSGVPELDLLLCIGVPLGTFVAMSRDAGGTWQAIRLVSLTAGMLLVVAYLSMRSGLGWKLIHTACAGLTALSLLSRHFLPASLFGLVLLGLSLAFIDATRSTESDSVSITGGFLYASVVTVTWLLNTGRIHLGPTRFRRATDAVRGQPAAQMPEGIDDLLTQAVGKERRRIAQDLHDSVGSRLVGLLAEHDPRDPLQRMVAAGIEECLLELRLIVDSFIATGIEPLPHSLGRLRHRVQPAFDRMGIDLHWNIELDETLENLKPGQAAGLLRICQEALTNIIRHARTASVTVSLTYDRPVRRATLEIGDTGRGFAINSLGSGAGRGIEGMRQRAIDAGGEFSIVSVVNAGTVITVSIYV